MEVKFHFKIKVFFIFVLLTACAQNKTTDSVFTQQKIGSVSCPTQAIMKNQFVVRYEDGHLEVVRSENVETFKNKFVKPQLEKIKNVEFDSLVYVNQPTLQIFSSVSSGLSTDDYGAATIRAPDAWNQGIKGDGVVVAILDQAVDISHAYLKNQFAINAKEAAGITGGDDDQNGYTDDYIGWNFITGQSSGIVTESSQYHGTHVAGIIAGDGTQGNFSGVAPGAKILPATFLDETHGSAGTAILAMRYSVQRGAKILNASWGGYDCSTLLREEIAILESKNVLFVAAAGNSGTDYDRGGRFEYPAVFNLPAMLSVAATNAQDFLSGFSNRSFFLVQLAAPGDFIRSTVPTSFKATGFDYLSGTSMAAPFVSGAAALLWSAKPNASVSQIRQALLSGVDNRQLKVSTQGRLNVLRSLEEIRRIVP